MFVPIAISKIIRAAALLFIYGGRPMVAPTTAPSKEIVGADAYIRPHSSSAPPGHLPPRERDWRVDVGTDPYKCKWKCGKSC